ncbi:hypothetical protein K9K77_00120 [Candidatus Babeliales bacterium]|nr:hypothetical protein [Candidatus Babeliales bacterium]
MKKILVYVMLVGVNFLQSHSAQLECPSTLSLKKTQEFKRFGLSIQKDILENSNAISQLYIKGNLFFNGKPIPFTEELRFFDDYPVEDVEMLLDKSVLLPDKSGIHNGIIECVYKVPGNHDKEQYFMLKTDELGQVYKCPDPEELQVVNSLETSFIKLVALPRNNKGDSQPLQQEAIEIYAFFKDFVIPENQEKNSYFNLKYNPLQEFIGKRSLMHVALNGAITVFKGEDNEQDKKRVITHFKTMVIRGNEEKNIMIDPTDKEGRPMIFEWRGDRTVFYQTYSYQLRGRIAEIDILSPAIDKNFEFVRGNKVITPPFVNGINRGFNIKNPVNEFGKLLIPSCSAISLFKKDDETVVQCIYGDNKDPHMNIVLEGDFSKKVREQSCEIQSGKYKLQNIHDILQEERIVIVPSLSVKKDHSNKDDEESFVSPLVLICQEK